MGRGWSRRVAFFRKGVALFFWTGFFLRESGQGAKKKDDKEMSHHQPLSGFVAGCKPAGKFLAFLGILDRAERNLADLDQLFFQDVDASRHGQHIFREVHDFS